MTSSVKQLFFAASKMTFFYYDDVKGNFQSSQKNKHKDLHKGYWFSTRRKSSEFMMNVSREVKTIEHFYNNSYLPLALLKENFLLATFHSLLFFLFMLKKRQKFSQNAANLNFLYKKSWNFLCLSKEFLCQN